MNKIFSKFFSRCKLCKWKYDVSQATKYYKANIEYSSTNSAISVVRLQGMADSTGKIFFPEYAQGVSGQAGTQSGGQVKQYGSQYLELNKSFIFSIGSI